MTHALMANVVMCAEPGANTERGERINPGCCQPGTEIVEYDGVELEFCAPHAVKRWMIQDAERRTASESE